MTITGQVADLFPDDGAEPPPSPAAQAFSGETITGQFDLSASSRAHATASATARRDAREHWRDEPRDDRGRWAGNVTGEPDNDTMNGTGTRDHFFRIHDASADPQDMLKPGNQVSRIWHETGDPENDRPRSGVSVTRSPEDLARYFEAHNVHPQYYENENMVELEGRPSDDADFDPDAELVHPARIVKVTPVKKVPQFRDLMRRYDYDGQRYRKPGEPKARAYRPAKDDPFEAMYAEQARRQQEENARRNALLNAGLPVTAPATLSTPSS